MVPVQPSGHVLGSRFVDQSVYQLFQSADNFLACRFERGNILRGDQSVWPRRFAGVGGISGTSSERIVRTGGADTGQPVTLYLPR